METVVISCLHDKITVDNINEIIWGIYKAATKLHEAKMDFNFTKWYMSSETFKILESNIKKTITGPKEINKLFGFNIVVSDKVGNNEIRFGND